MVIFAAGTFCIIPIIFTVVVVAHIISDTSLEYVLWPLRLVFIASPWVGLFLGLRGSLPGTKLTAATERHTNTTFKILAFFAIVSVGMFILGGWVAFLPPPGSPNISITFLGYTNDAAGTRLARFTITNRNPSTIFAYSPNIEIQSPTEPREAINYWPGYNQWQQLHSKLDEGASTNFTIIPPTNQAPWRLSVLVYPDRGRSVKNSIKSAVGISYLSVGLWPMFWKFMPLGGAFRHPYNMEGDWIPNAR